MRKASITWNKFEDCFPNIMIKNISTIQGRDAVFLADFYDGSQSMFEQLAVIYSLPGYLVKGLTIVLPYFPPGTMERVDEEGQIATSRTLTRLLSATPITTGGPVKIIIYDIHALQTRFYFSDRVIPILLSAVHLLKDAFNANHQNEKLAICFPDDGACKRFGKMFDAFPILICNKIRQGNERIISIKDGDPTGYHVFIVDDLVQSGGTLITCKDALLARGAAKVSAYVTHAVFPKQSWKKFLHTGKDDDKQFAHFYLTDSCPISAKAVQDKIPFRILPLAPSIANALLEYR